MLVQLKRLLTAPAPQRQRPSEVLSAALLLTELARSDLEVAAVELDTIRRLLAERYALEAAEVERLLDEARARGAVAVSLYDYVQTLNGQLDPAGKSELMTMLWQVAYADGRLDPYEEHLLRRVAGMLYVTDAEFIRTKLSVAGTPVAPPAET